MKLRILLITVSVLAAISGFSQKKYLKSSNAIESIHTHEGHEGCTLFITDLVRNVNIPYDLEKARSRAKSGNAQDAVFDVDYIGFTAEAQGALQFSFDVLSTLITSSVPIRVEAIFTAFEEPGQEGVLGFSSTTGYLGGYGSVYPIALAEKIEGFSINDAETDYDIALSINSLANWHFEPTDTVGGIGTKFDLATIMMHEIIHGLGFIGGAGELNNGTFGIRFNNGDASIYDAFLENAEGVPLLDIGADESPELGTALTSGSLFFNSPRLTTPLEIYTPTTFASGSSIYHLNENTTPEADLMMTPFAARGEIRHNPGAAADMLLDMGWDFTAIVHDQSPILSEDFGQDYLVSAEFISDSGFDTSSVMMVYSRDSFVLEAITVPMSFNMATGQFEATIPAPNAETIYQYRIDATQVGAITEISGPAFFYDFYNHAYIQDNIAPVIEHIDILSINSTDIEFPVKAIVADLILTDGIVNDSLGTIDVVSVEYTINDGTVVSVDANLDGDGFGEFYLANVPISVALTSTDVFKYRIVATDLSIAQNMGFYPADGSYITVPINEINDPADLYTNDFNDITNTDFSFVQFELAEVDGFEDGTLTTAGHPYETAGDGATLDFTSVLKTPIIIAADAAAAFIKFEEIALVEPSTEGTVFGDFEFWDYVIVEAQKLSGGPWEPLLDGYDAREHLTWRINYEGTTTGQISNSVPVPSMLKDRELSLLGADSPFVAGDTVLVRFRLFSDPAAAGWGWLIDNLNIQDANTNVAVEDFIQEENQFQVYPNPSNTGRITVLANFTQAASNLRTELTDIHGRLIRSVNITNGSKYYEEEIDISDLPAGIYFMTLRDNESAITKKVVKY